MSLQLQRENYVHRVLRVTKCCSYLVNAINTRAITDSTLMVLVLLYMKVPDGTLAASVV